MAARKSPAEGRKGDKLWRDALMVAVKRECEDGGKTKKLAALAAKLVERGLDGDVTALKEIGDRLDGKPTRGVEHSGKASVSVEISDLSTLDRAMFIGLALRKAAEIKDAKDQEAARAA